jgi:hypothetical protein
LSSPADPDGLVRRVEEKLASFPVVKKEVSEKQFGEDILVRLSEPAGGGVKPLSKISSVPQYLRGFNRVRFYAPIKCRDSAARAVGRAPA